MKNSSEIQLILEFPSPPRIIVRNTERTRDSDGHFAPDMLVDGNETDRLKYENEMLQRKYLAIAKQLASIERELLKYKNADL